MRQAAVDVVFQDQHRDLVGGGGHGLDLLEDVEAVGLVLDQALEATGLTLDPAQPVQKLMPVTRVAVAEVLNSAGDVVRVHTRG